MGYCPICKSPASEETRDGGDYRRVTCRKCGRYQITGTALSMLESRLRSADEKAVARLSHAARMMTTTADADWPEINSVNLDEMLQRPLPATDRQIINFLSWAAAQLGDDYLGVVELPDESDLTGVVGTIDGRRVEALIERITLEDLIEYVSDDCIRITSTGWARLTTPEAKQKDERQTQSEIPSTSPAHRSDRTIKAHCNRCRGTTNSWVRAEHTETGSDGPISWSETFEVLQCCGCDTLSVRHEHWFSEWDDIDQDEFGREFMRRGIKETFYPAPTVRAKATWSDQIKDDVLRNVLDELYIALFPVSAHGTDSGLSFKECFGLVV